MDKPRLSPFGSLLQSSVRLYSSIALALLTINFIFIMPVLGVLYLISEGMILLLGELTSEKLVWLRVVLGILACVFSLSLLVSMGALLIYIVNSFRREKINIWGAFRLSFKRFPQFLKASFVYTLKVLGGWLLLVLPGVYFGIVHAFAPLMVLIEDMKITEAMARSQRMVKPHIFQYTDYSLFAALVAMASCVPFLVIFNFLTDWSMDARQWYLAAVFDFIIMGVTLMAAQFILVFYVCLYEELRAQPS